MNSVVGIADAHYVRTLAILSTLMAFASISTDLFLPALPTMALALKAPSGSLQFTISGYLVGFSLGQLVWGPVADRYGRRKPIAVGLLFFVLGSAGCAMAGSVEMLIVWRVVQALGACASVVLSRAIVRDMFHGTRAAQVMSTLMTVMAIAPLIGPSVGSIILQFGSWRVIFWALVAVGLATLAALHFLPETLPVERRRHESLSRAFQGYAELIVHRPLLGSIGVVAFYYGGTFAYIAGSPFAYIDYYHISPHSYGLLFAAGIVGIMILNQANSRLLRRYRSDILVRVGCAGAAITGVLTAFDAWTGFGGLLGLVLPLFVFISASGLIAANSMASALNHFPDRAGAVSALMGALQYGMGIIGSALVGLLNDGTPWPMAVVIALASISGLLCAVFLLPRGCSVVFNGTCR